MNVISVLKNMKIRSKLLSSFAVTTIFMLILGVTAYNNGKNIQKNLADICKKKLPSLDYLIEADRDLQQLLVAERTMLFTDPSSELYNSMLEEYETNLQQADKRWNSFCALADSNKEKALIDKYNVARKEWEKISRKVLETRMSGTDKDRQAAIALSVTEAKTKFENMRDQLDQLEEINLNLTDEAYTSASKSYAVLK